MDVKFGRLAPHPEETHPRIYLTQFLDTALALPTIPTQIDYLSPVPSWPMYLNDQIGDCTCAAAGHMIQSWTKMSGGTDVQVSDQDVLAAYETVSGYRPGDPSTDNGAVMQDVLNMWRKQGIGGHKILAFAQVDVTDLAQVYAALYLFDGVYIGINFPQSAMDQFDAGQPWSVLQDDGGIIGGHAINTGGRDNAELAGVTWGRVQRFDEAWWKAYVEEAWVVLDGEWITSGGTGAQGIDVTALNAAYTELTHQPGPFPVTPTPTPSPTPAPTPDPGPGPGPDDADRALAAVVREHNWVHREHFGDNRHVAHAIDRWLTRKGL